MCQDLTKKIPKIATQKQPITDVKGIHEELETGVVYHLPKKSGNFGWNVNGKINFVSLYGNFLGKTEFPKGKCEFRLLVFTSSRPFGLDRL